MTCANVCAVDAALMGGILEPYKEHCRYLKHASIERGGDASAPGAQAPLIGRGAFCIPQSCYIADTGHFNAVEFNICYNQLAYVTFAAFTVANQVEALSGMTLQEFRAKQLSNMLIGNLSSSFKRPIDACSFHARISFDRLSARGSALFMKTSISFTDEQDGFAAGEVLLVLLDVVRQRRQIPAAFVPRQIEALGAVHT